MTYVLQSVGWSVLGFVIGYLTAYWVNRSGQRMSNRLLGVFLVLMAVLSVTYGLVNNQRYSDTIECQANYDRQFRQAVDARLESNTREHENLTIFLERWSAAKDNPAKQQAALDAYLADRAKNRSTTAAEGGFNIPDYPSECKP